MSHSREAEGWLVALRGRRGIESDLRVRAPPRPPFAHPCCDHTCSSWAALISTATRGFLVPPAAPAPKPVRPFAAGESGTLEAAPYSGKRAVSLRPAKQGGVSELRR